MGQDGTNRVSMGKKSAEKDRKEQKRTPDRIGIRVGGNKLCQERT